MRLVNWRALVAGAAGLGLAACGDDVTIAPPQLQYTVNPTAVTCTTGQTTAVGLTVTGGSGTPTIAFTAQNGGVTVTGSGSSATVVCGNTAGASAVNFTITSGGQTVTGSIPVTINAPANQGNTSVVAISVTPTAVSLVPGGTTIITPQVTLANGAPATTSTAVTYTSSDTTIARVTTNANGTATVTAVNSAANTAGRQAVITATPTANTNLRAFTTVTIAPASALISSFQISPNTVNIGTGQTQQITANVQLAPGAPAGTSTAVTYTSSDTSIARVSATGLITAGSRAGTATITVAPSAAPSLAQQIGVTVTAPTPVRLTIQSIEVVNVQGNRVPVDPANVGTGNATQRDGNLYVTLNLDPGTYTPDSVVVTLGGVRQNCQRFTAQLAQALHASLTSGSADFAPIVCTINTAAFDTTTGIGQVLNGNRELSATVFYRPSTTAAASTSQTSTIVRQLTLNNVSGFFANVTNTPSTTQAAVNALGQATGPQGVLWRAGTINVSVLPVNFVSPSPGTTTFNPTTVALVDIDPNGALRTVATRTTAQGTTGAMGTVSFAGDVGCFWEASATVGNGIAPASILNAGNTLANYGQLYTNAANAGGSAQGFCSGLTGNNVTGFNADPSQATLVGYTTPGAGTTTTGGTNIPAGIPRGTWVVIGGTTIGTGAQLLGASGQLLQPPANSPALPGTNVAAAIFIDNQAPQPVARSEFDPNNFAFSVDPTNTQTRLTGFFNASQTFSGNTFTFRYIDPVTGALVATNPDFGGVDRVTEAFFYAANSGAASTTTTTNPTTFVGSSAARAATGTSGIGSLANNNFYRLASGLTDALGNRRNQIVNQITNFGTGQATIVQTFFNVDVLAPTLGLVRARNTATGASRISADTTIFSTNAYRTGFTFLNNVTVNPELAFTFSDDIGFGFNPISIRLTRYNRAANGNLQVTCFSGIDSVTTPGTRVAVFSTLGALNVATCPRTLIPGVPVSFATAGATTGNGVYVGDARARDQAGNLSDPITVNFVIDTQAPANISVSLPQVLAGNSAVSFTAGATDNVAVASAAPRVMYGAPINADFQGSSALIYNPTTAVSLANVFSGLFTASGAADATSIGSVFPQNQSAMTLTIPSFIRSVTRTAGNQNNQTFAAAQAGAVYNAPIAGAAGFTTAQTLQAEIFDLANNSAISTALPIPAANIPNAPAASPFLSTNNQVNNLLSFSLFAAAGGSSVTPVNQGVQAAPACGPTGVSSNTPAGCQSSVTFTVVQTGAGSTYLSQLTRIELWVFDPIANGYRQIGTFPIGSTTDVPASTSVSGQAVRIINTQLTLPVNTLPYFLAPNAGSPAISYTFVAIGVNGSGDAIVSNAAFAQVNP